MERFRPDAVVGAVVVGVIDERAVQPAGDAVQFPVRFPGAGVDNGTRQPQHKQRAEPSCMFHEVASSDGPEKVSGPLNSKVQTPFPVPWNLHATPPPSMLRPACLAGVSGGKRAHAFFMP